jgi:membrane protein YqaA with SNARE-associated domain
MAANTMGDGPAGAMVGAGSGRYFHTAYCGAIATIIMDVFSCGTSVSMIQSAIVWLLALLGVPQVGLTAVFIISFVSATLIPMGSEPAVFLVVKANGALFWPVILLATAGNTLGGVVDYWMGYGAKSAFAEERSRRWFGWLLRHGAKTMLLAWVPLIGDPICTLAGWLKLPFWPSVVYMAIGKLIRYIMMTYLLLHVPDGFWRQLASYLS